MTPLPRHDRGYSITELMVAMVVGLLLLGGLVMLMVNSKKHYAQQDYSSRLQESARIAMQLLSYDVRMAGYYGCSNDVINDDAVTAFDVPDPASRPDEVTITYGEAYDADNPVVLTGVDGSDARFWALNRVPRDWSAGDEVVVSDCAGAAVTTLAALDRAGDTVTVSGGLDRTFDPAVNDNGPITVRRLVRHSYAIDETGASGIPVLTRNGRELVEGIERLRFLYQAAAGRPFESGASGPASAVAVKIGALVRSISNESLADREHGSGAGLSVDDGRHTLLDRDFELGTLRGQRRGFTGTLAVRNRSP